jgi:hypothetical protein
MAARGASSANSAAGSRGGGGKQRFRVSFVGSRVVEAATLQEAIRQVEALGASDITSISREG